MTIERSLPQTNGGLFLTDSGLETTLVFHDKIDLPCFAAFGLLDIEAGRARLARYCERHARIALDAGLGFVFEGATWRASADWGAKLGYDAPALDRVNRRSIRLMRRR